MYDLDDTLEAPIEGDIIEAERDPLSISLTDFVSEFGDELLDRKSVV